MLSIAVLIFAQASKGLTKTPTHALQGLFCNTPDQIDDALTHMRRGLSPRVAVGLVNHEEVVQEVRSPFPLFKYQGTLVAVIARNAVRPIAPPVHIFFAIPERLDDTPVEGRA
jgi:hypothetical protein